MGYKHSDQRLDQIGRDLSVQYVLESSLRESGDHLRLCRPAYSGEGPKPHRIDYPVKNILNVEDEVAKAVANEIPVRLTSKQ